MSRYNKPPPKKKPNNSPIRVVIRCAWLGGARLTVPTTSSSDETPLPPIKSKSTLYEIVSRLADVLPTEVFHEGSGATLVCLRKLVPRSEWDSTTLRTILDGDDGSAGVVLTLDLGVAGGAADASGPVKSNPVKSAISSAASALNIKPVAMPTPNATITTSATAPSPIAPSAPCEPEPMDISTPETASNMQPEEAWSKILQSNFDAATKDCLNTLLKIIDNLLSRPNEPKVRSIRCANAAFEKKVGRCVGGYEFLYSLGFVPVIPAIGGQQPETLEMPSQNESRELLLQGRKVLVQSASRDLGINEDDLPPVPKALAEVPASALSAPPSAARTQQGTTVDFNVYKGHSFNVQSAAVGVPNPYSDASSTLSTTERQLQQLQSKKSKLEREMQAAVEMDRGLIAYLPGTGPSGMVPSASSANAGPVEGKGDSSLVAARMKRMEEERKKREDGGFTTKAMRDLEKLKKTKVSEAMCCLL
eukprot:scaffold387_cov195-Alexandrium_tamarense.AAC.27